MKLAVHVRTNTPWATMSRASFVAQASVINLPRGIKERCQDGSVIDLWEQATGLSFFGYREAIKRVCQAKMRHLIQDSDADIIVPVDDDDIIFDSVLGVVPYFLRYPSVNIVCWDRITVVHGTERLEGMRYCLDTCNWAIRRSYLESFSLEDQGHILGEHQVAHGIIARDLGRSPPIVGVLSPTYFRDSAPRNLEHPSILDVREEHSRYYLHSGSISWLGHKMGASGDQVAKLRCLPLHPLFDAGVYLQVMVERDIHVSQAV